MRNVRKKIGCLALSLAAAITIAGAAIPLTAQAATLPKATLDAGWNASKNNFESKQLQQITDSFTGALIKEANSEKLNPTGVSNAKISLVVNDDFSDIMDKTIKPVMTEFAKASIKLSVNGAKPGTSAEDVKAIYYGKLQADQPGDITFTIEEKFSDAFTGNAYALVLHYTGKSSDDDGVTAQYAKISANGRVKAHFNSYSPFAILVTEEENLQMLVNTYYHSAGSDSGTAEASVNTSASTATQSQTVANTNTVQQNLANAAAVMETPAASTSSTSSASTSTSSASTSTTSSSQSASSSSSSGSTYPAYSGGNISIVDALKACGESDTSFKHRKAIAAANGISGYKGNNAQNEQLVSLLRKGQLKKA